MIGSNFIVHVVVSLAMSCASIAEASIISRQEKAPWTYGLQKDRFFKYKSVTGESDEVQPYVDQQALSLARFPGSEEKNFFWFFEKKESLVKLLGDGPGPGCVVILSFDDVVGRAKDGKGRKWKNEKGWAVPSSMTPWCGDAHAPKDNNEYGEDDFGYQRFRREGETLKEKAVYITLGQLGDMENSKSETVKVEDYYTTYASAEIQQEVEKDYAEFQDKLLEILRKDFAEVPNPYNFGKAESRWSKKKTEIFFGGE